MTDFLMDGSRTPRRKSRILPSMLFKRSLGTAATTHGQGSELGTWMQSMRKDAPEGTIAASAAAPTFPGFDKTWSDTRRGGEFNGVEAGLETAAVTTAAAGTIGSGHQVTAADSGLVGPTASLSTAVMLDDQPLDRLCDAMNQLVDKMSAVAAIHMDLANFNESFGALLYGLKMNASTIEWTEAPTKESFERQEQREREAELLQEQQKELERIRREQLELERQREVERREQERLAAEEHQRQLHMSRRYDTDVSRSRIPRTGAAQGVAGGRGMSSRPGLSRPMRPTTSSAASSSSGPMRVRASGRAGGSAVGADSLASGSRVSQGGQVRKVKGRVVMKRMLDRLPLKYREEPHRSVLGAIMTSLEDHTQGQSLPELTAVSGVTRQRCNEYLGVLIQAKEVARSNQRGVIFILNPDRYPTPQRRD